MSKLAMEGDAVDRLLMQESAHRRLLTGIPKACDSA
jgi:hypothetical protein